MSIKKPKDIKFLYFAAVLLLLGAFDLYMLLFVVGKSASLEGVLVPMVIVNAAGFGMMGIILFVIARMRSRRARMQMWHDMIREATKKE